MPVDRKYLISDEIKQLLNNPKTVNRQLRLGKTRQQILGFSPEAMEGFYFATYRLIEQQRYDDAADAFFFLTQITPAVKSFWMGLGDCEGLAGRIEQAIPAYMMAIGIDHSDKECYLKCAYGLYSLDKVEEALEILDMGIAHADESPQEATSVDLRNSCLEYKQWFIAHGRGEKMRYG